MPLAVWHESRREAGMSGRLFKLAKLLGIGIFSIPRGEADEFCRHQGKTMNERHEPELLFDADAGRASFSAVAWRHYRSDCAGSAGGDHLCRYLLEETPSAQAQDHDFAQGKGHCCSKGTGQVSGLLEGIRRWPADGEMQARR